MKILLFLLAAACLVATAGAAECRPAAGRQTFANKCGICHVVEPGAGHGVGPNLHGVVGRPVGRAEGFAYSEAMSAANATWEPPYLDGFLQSPQQALPGTAMPFQGLKSAADREQLICFLQRLK